MAKHSALLVVVLLVILSTVSCGQKAEPTPTARVEGLVATATIQPVDTVGPTDVPTATEAAPTATEVMAEEPTETAAPTVTMEPSATTVPPTPVPPSATPTATVAPTEEAKPMWTPDGLVGEGEYANESQMGQVLIRWSNDADWLYLSIEAETEGWVSIGLAPVNRMQGANYLFGYVADDEAQIWDAWGVSPVGATHPPDTELGGTRDIVAFAGLEADGITRLEVQIPLDSGDEYDQALQPGQSYPVIVALGRSDAYNAGHAWRGAGSIMLDPAP